MQQSEEYALIEKVRSGDHASFELLYNEYKRKILNYLNRMLGNREKAEELAQETFVKAYLNLDKYKPIGTFSSWLYAIARNLARNEFRRLSHEKSISLETPIDKEGDLKLEDVLKSDSFDIEEEIKRHEIQQQITETLDKLPFESKEVIVLCIMESKSYEEAAEIMGCTKANVAIKLFRARKHFIQVIGKKDRQENEVQD